MCYLNTLRKRWLPPSILSPCPGGDKREGAGREDFLNGLLCGRPRPGRDSPTNSSGAALYRATLLILGLSLTVPMLAGCLGAEIEANRRQLQAQQAELDKLKEEVAALGRQQQQQVSGPAPAGSCDAAVMREATRLGGQRFAASEFTRAVGYYQDALTACPGNAEGELNLARAYEALGELAAALEHYSRASAAAAGAADASIGQQAREALSRLRATK